jgi:hypothetical protein
MVRCRVNNLSQWILDKNKFSGVSMIRLVYDGEASDYTRWKLNGQNILFYKDNKIETSLDITYKIKIVDDLTIVVNNNIGLELFYGGAILP